LHIIVGIILSGIFLIFSIIFTAIVDFNIGLWAIHASLLFVLLAFAECEIVPVAARKAYENMMGWNLLLLITDLLVLIFIPPLAWIFAVSGYALFALNFVVPIFVARKEEVTV